ncbi:MAG: hypothetical protein JNK63_06710 [Chthonomonas sp.]|nr:hypothetical protein [Chthonomonas sp.]
MKTWLFLVPIVMIGCTETGNQRADQVGHTAVGQSMARAKDEVCMENLRQIRAAIVIAMTNADETPPGSLAELRLPAEMIVDPIDKKPYTYDASTGNVKCDHPGHKKY